MKLKELSSINLPKWPGLVVIGDKISEEEAAEVLIRTNIFDYGCNNKAWMRIVAKLLNVKMNDNYFDYHDTERINKEYGILELGYLDNARIMSAWIGGTKGWCNWDGTIRCGNFNIGKWPSTEEVAQEWSRIAEAFPFLNLRAQLLDEEIHSEVEGKPVIEYQVSNGRCTFSRPTHVLPLEENYLNESFFLKRFNRLAPIHDDPEVGCTEEKLAWALKITKERLASKLYASNSQS